MKRGGGRGRGRKATLDNLKLDKCLMCGLHDKILSMAKFCGWPDVHLFGTGRYQPNILFSGVGLITNPVRLLDEN